MAVSRTCGTPRSTDMPATGSEHSTSKTDPVITSRLSAPGLPWATILPACMSTSSLQYSASSR